MKQLAELKLEIAKMRLQDLAKQYGKESSRVNNYREKIVTRTNLEQTQAEEENPGKENYN